LSPTSAPEETSTPWRHPINTAIRLLRAALVAALGLCLWNAAQARWKSAALKRCIELHRELTSHPHLAELLSDRTHAQRVWGVDDMTRAAIDAGVPHEDAIAVSRTLAHITLNDALAVVKSRRCAATGQKTDANPERHVIEAVGLVLEGVRARTAKPRSVVVPPSATGRKGNEKKSRTDDQAAELYRS
jgi:hypothetical protein